MRLTRKHLNGKWGIFRGYDGKDYQAIIKDVRKDIVTITYLVPVVEGDRSRPTTANLEKAAFEERFILDA